MIGSNLVNAEPTVVERWQTQTEQWLELEQRLANESSAWLTDQEVMKTSRTLLEKEQQRLTERVAANALSNQLFSKRLHDLQSELAAQEDAQGSLAQRLVGLETRLRGFYPQLPIPLRERLDPLLARLDSATKDNPVTLSERTQTLVSILSAIDQFNGSVTLTHHLRMDGQGQEIDVQVIYWGLAAGYAVDATDKQSWLVVPGTDGWDWQEAPGIAGRVRELIEIYERKRSPALVSLPTVKEGARP